MTNSFPFVHFRITAPDKGANDYGTKPFSSAEGRLPGGKFTLRDLEIIYDARQVFVKREEIKLTQGEYNIVTLLSENCGKMMTYTSIIKAIWGGIVHEGSIKKLQVNMANIRRKLGWQPGEVNDIISKLGVGYRMNAEHN